MRTRLKAGLLLSRAPLGALFIATLAGCDPDAVDWADWLEKPPLSR